MTAAWTPAPGGFLERNPHLIENYLAVCAEFGETPGDVPEEVGLVGRERPPEHVFEMFRRLHGVGPSRDYQALLRHEITSEEYVRRLEARVDDRLEVERRARRLSRWGRWLRG